MCVCIWLNGTDGIYLHSFQAGASINTEKKTITNAGHANRDHQRIAKLDRENDVAPPPKVDVSVGRVIAKARMEKSFTQKDLAQRINEKPQVVCL